MSDKTMGREEAVRQAIARGWCTPENLHKEMDIELAEAIAREVITALTAQPAGEAVAWSVLKIGSTGSAYDLPHTRRAFTYDHQPGNLSASRLGSAAYAMGKLSAGDSIDKGLGLLKALQEAGFGVFQLGPHEKAPTTGDGNDFVKLCHDGQPCEKFYGKQPGQPGEKVRGLMEKAQALIDADVEYEDARRNWDRAIADDPIRIPADEWKQVSTRFENAVMGRIAKRNELAAALGRGRGSDETNLR